MRRTGHTTPSAELAEHVPSAHDILVRRPSAATAIVVLKRPHRRNAITLDMWRRLGQTVAELAEDSRTRVIVITGADGHFSGGADITEFRASRAGARAGSAYDRAVEASVRTLLGVDKPTIAAITGFCLGGGCAVATACDFRFADPSARFGIPAARLGTVYGAGLSQNLLSLVGLAKAKELLFTGRQLDASEAAAIGLVDAVVPAPVIDAALAFASSLVASAPLSIAGAKLILGALSTGAAVRRRREIAVAIKRAAESLDYQEGIRAFLEKRPPVFRGC